MKKLLVLILAILMVTLPALAQIDQAEKPITETMTPQMMIQEWLLPELKDNPKKLLTFAAELNISNGNPKSRDYGERYMFGKLVSFYTIAGGKEDFTERLELIYDEVERLLLGPWHNNGGSEMNYGKVSAGYLLDLENVKWRKTSGGNVIRIMHITEYVARSWKRVGMMAGG